METDPAFPLYSNANDNFEEMLIAEETKVQEEIKAEETRALQENKQEVSDHTPKKEVRKGKQKSCTERTSVKKAASKPSDGEARKVKVPVIQV